MRLKALVLQVSNRFLARRSDPAADIFFPLFFLLFFLYITVRVRRLGLGG